MEVEEGGGVGAIAAAVGAFAVPVALFEIKSLRRLTSGIESSDILFVNLLKKVISVVKSPIYMDIDNT